MYVTVVNNNTGEFEQGMTWAKFRALEKIGITAEGYAKQKAPVDTGRLRNSITHQVMSQGGTDSVMIGTNVEYAPYVELGTSRQKAQPYLVPAANDHLDQWRDILRRELGGR